MHRHFILLLLLQGVQYVVNKEHKWKQGTCILSMGFCLLFLLFCKNTYRVTAFIPHRMWEPLNFALLNQSDRKKSCLEQSDHTTEKQNPELSLLLRIFSTFPSFIMLLPEEPTREHWSERCSACTGTSVHLEYNSHIRSDVLPWYS